MEEKRNVGFAIKSTSHMIRRNLDRIFSAPEFDGLTGMQYAVMGYIMDRAGEQDVFQRDIEKHFSTRRSTVTVMLQSLEQKGYICRIPVSCDARLKKIILTEKAEKMQKRVCSEIDRFHEKLEENLTPEEREQLLYLLEKVNKNL